MNKRIEDFQYTVGIVFFILVIVKMTRLFSINSFLLVFASPLVFILFLIAFYHLISKWRISKLLSILLFVMTIVESLALTAILFSMFFWPGAYIMTISAVYAYIFSFLSIIIFYFVSDREIKPFHDYRTELDVEEAIVPGLDGELERKEENLEVPLIFEWRKFLVIFFVLMFFYLLPIQQRVDWFASNPSASKQNLVEKYLKEKEGYHSR